MDTLKKLEMCKAPSNKECPHHYIHVGRDINYTWHYCSCWRQNDKKKCVYGCDPEYHGIIVLEPAGE
jgi:hypothetical protein